MRELVVDLQWSVRRVEREVGEPRLGATVVDPVPCGLAEDIGAVTFSGHPCAIVQNVWVEVVVIPVVRRLADAAALMNEDFVEAPVLWAARVGFAEVPFAEDRGAIASGLEVLGERRDVRLEQAATADGVGDADFEFMLAGHQCGTGGGAGRGG